MRHLLVCIVSVACCPVWTVAFAQAPAAPAPVDPALLAALRGWERVMTTSTNFYSACTAVRANGAAKTSDAYKGYVMCAKPGYAKTRVELAPAAGQPAAATAGVYEEYIITPQAVYEYTGDGVDRTTGKPKVQNAIETVFGPGQRPQNVMLDFLSGGMTADAAMKRFDIKLIKSDQNYLYLAILPRNAVDSADFAAMMMILYQPETGFGYLPARVKFTKDSLGQRSEEWSFTEPCVNHPEIVAKKFAPKDIAPGDPAWKVTRRPAGPGAAAPGR